MCVHGKPKTIMEVSPTCDQKERTMLPPLAPKKNKRPTFQLQTCRKRLKFDPVDRDQVLQQMFDTHLHVDQLLECLPPRLFVQAAKLVLQSVCADMSMDEFDQFQLQCAKKTNGIQLNQYAWIGLYTFGFTFGNEVCAIVGKTERSLLELRCATLDEFNQQMKDTRLYDYHNIMHFLNGLTSEDIFMKVSLCNQNGMFTMMVREELTCVQKMLQTYKQM